MNIAGLSDRKNRSIRTVLMSVCVFFVVLGLIDPSFGSKTGKDSQLGLDVMVMLDVSKSMQVMDIDDAGGRISRLDSAKIMLEKFVTESPENRYGLGVFAGEALGIAPLTSDVNLFLTFLSGVDHRNVSRQGTELQSAIDFGLARFESGVLIDSDSTKDAPDDEKIGRVLMILSDGGEDDISLDASFVTDLRNAGVFVMTVGVGTQAGGSIPVSKDMFGNISYKQYEGQTVVTAFDPDGLKKLAKQTDGSFYRLEDASDIKPLVSYVQNLDKKEFLENTSEKRKLGRRFVFIGLISFLSTLVLGLMGFDNIEIGKLKKNNSF